MAARLPHPMHWFAVSAPGAEEAVLAEIRAVAGVRKATRVTGGVEFESDWPTALRANLWSACATRIWMRVARGRARTFSELRGLCDTVPWRALLRSDVPVRIEISPRASRLYHTGAVAERVAVALRAGVGAGGGADRGSDSGADPDAGAHGEAIELRFAESAEPGCQRVLARGVGDLWTLSVDSSGERLHQRGWRAETGAAALRESLAAIVLALCRWERSQALVDGMCGSGTFAIEAARSALAIAPGLERDFAMLRWPAIDAGRASEIRAKARAACRDGTGAKILAADRNPEMVERARRNAQRARCAEHIAFTETPLAALEPPAPTGLLVLNPPYGRRLAAPSRRALRDTYSEIDRVLAGPFRAWRAGVLVPNAELGARIHARSEAVHPLRNGGVRVELRVYGARG